MNSKSRHGWTSESVTRLVRAIHDVQLAPGPHLTDDQLDAYAEERLDEDMNAYANSHIEGCEQCAIAAEARFEHCADVVEDPAPLPREATASEREGTRSIVFAPIGGSPAVRPALIFQPHHPRHPKPGCVEPLERAARDVWPGLVIREPKDRPFSTPRFPAARITKSVCPLIVTTAFRASYEHQRGNDWRVVIPLALAPRDTRIVTTTKSPLAGLRDYQLAAKLDGRCIAVADATSTFAARLASAAAHYGITAVRVSGRPEKAAPRTLYLVTMDFDAMSPALKSRDIDGFATVEPFPTVAKLLLGSKYAEASLSEQCTSTSTGFCCVVIAPRALMEEARYQHTYEALVRALFRSVWRVLVAAKLEVREAGGSHGANMHPDLGRQAAAAMLRHLTVGLDVQNESDSALIEKLVAQFVPEVTPESLNADFEALSRFLSAKECRALQVATARRPHPEALYSTKRLRELCQEAIAGELASKPIADKITEVNNTFSWSAIEATASAAVDDIPN